MSGDSGGYLTDVVAGIAESLSDKHFSDNDMRRGAKDIFDVIAKMTVLLAAMSARHAADNARAER